uniref:Cyclic pyranopterin monophosphate synthase n=1 Tax=Schlesneria paludicola TaxID=360056 RepID=A0A7C4QWX9_9PLAN
MTALTHFDEQGAARMVDVGGKEATLRAATAESFVQMAPQTLQLITHQQVAKGNVFEVARLAGIMAAKRTADLIPLCHPLAIDGVTVDLAAVDERTVRIVATVRIHGRTGVEMEALTAVSVAALTIYDMCKSVDRGMVLGPTRLLEKSGGRSGHFVSPSAAPPAT